MKRKRNLRALARAIMAVTAVVIIAGGVTYAALQSQPVKLTGNTIETTTAGLALSTDDLSFGSTHAGFDFNSLVPGAQSGQSYRFYLKNNGGAPLALRFSVSSTPLNPNNVDLSKVHVTLTPDSSHQAESFTMQNLVTANSTGGLVVSDPAELYFGNTAGFTMQVAMDADAISGNTASLSNIDFAFVGLAQVN